MKAFSDYFIWISPSLSYLLPHHILSVFCLSFLYPSFILLVSFILLTSFIFPSPFILFASFDFPIYPSPFSHFSHFKQHICINQLYSCYFGFGPLGSCAFLNAVSSLAHCIISDGLARHRKCADTSALRDIKFDTLNSAKFPT